MTVDKDSRVDDGDDVTPDDVTPDDVTPADAAGAAENAPEREVGLAGRWIRQCVTRWHLILLALLVIAAAGLVAGLYFFQYRPDQQINAAAQRDVVKAAADGSVALLSYS